MKIKVLLATALILFLPGCSGMMIPGLRLAPSESQKQAAEGADTLAGQLVVTGARPGSPAMVAVARMTRPSAVFAGPPVQPLDLDTLAQIEVDQWRFKEEQVKAARLRDDLRKRAMQITTVRLADIGKIIIEQEASVVAVLDRFAAVATIAEMVDDLADVIPDPRSPDDSRTQREIELAEQTAEAVKALSVAASQIAAQRVDVETLVDKSLDAADRTLGNVVEAKDRILGMVDEYLPEILGTISLFGAGGYALRQRSKGKKAKAETEATKADAAVTVAKAEARAEAVVEAINAANNGSANNGAANNGAANNGAANNGAANNGAANNSVVNGNG